MAVELWSVVGLSIVLIVLVSIQGAIAPLTQGFGWGLGNRDEPRDPTVLHRRATRTLANHMEGMATFAPLALIAGLGDLSSNLTVLGSEIYLGGRILFAVVYLVGVPVVRSLVWGAANVGLFMVLVGIIQRAMQAA